MRFICYHNILWYVLTWVEGVGELLDEPRHADSDDDDGEADELDGQLEATPLRLWCRGGEGGGAQGDQNQQQPRQPHPVHRSVHRESNGLTDRPRADFLRHPHQPPAIIAAVLCAYAVCSSALITWALPRRFCYLISCEDVTVWWLRGLWDAGGRDGANFDGQRRG